MLKPHCVVRGVLVTKALGIISLSCSGAVARSILPGLDEGIFWGIFRVTFFLAIFWGRFLMREFFWAIFLGDFL